MSQLYTDEPSEHVKAKDLILYKVNIDLNTQNTQRTALTNPNTDIVNDLGGQVLRPMDNIEKKFPAPANEHIHVIVKLPASPAGTKRKADEEMADDIREIKKDLKDLVKEESAVNISSVNHEDWDTVLQVAWINRDLELIDTTNDNNYLDTLFDLLPIKLTGTTDADISDKCSVKSFLSEFNIRILFGLKKEVDRVNVYQAMAELVAADLKSRYPVKKLTTTRDRAVALLRNELSPNNRANTGEAEQKLSRRKKLVEILGVPTVTHTDYNVSSDIAPIEDFFDTMTEEEIFKLKQGEY
ncbi:unnamed protein product [Rhizophagus irregularis]|uniref:Uncharacterized protein n=2 Tax=Rhizophagus irregularis TaxID=588596 RepID=A0A916E4C3_9GLOM|nr:hypothetical protein GLOIN_2v1770899 [Rhizophagus irregularis DAOM 181602=DAOM 197198]CAB4491712.1 unnamed protein product [Rhizophagus irregularis]CAB5359613.1 unnamed protein product [Rhizophagus irregularis]